MLPLSAAQSLAETILEQLAPLCSRIDLAGSIRRQRPHVSDIDIVALPIDSSVLRARVLRSRPHIVSDGPQNLIVRLRNEIQLDVYIAHPEQRDLLQTRPSNYGSLLLCRTGSKEHNIYLVERAKAMGLTWKTTSGLYDPDGYCLAAETETDIFTALNLDYIDPIDRERP